MNINSSVSKPNLKIAIEAAFKKAKLSGEQQGASPDQIISNLASEISDAIDAYLLATNLSVTVFPGQTVATSGGPGSTTSTGTGQ